MFLWVLCVFCVCVDFMCLCVFLHFGGIFVCSHVRGMYV